MTYEQIFIAQADLRTVRGSTTERKTMSTKTTFKRVALVAVASLGLGVLTSVSANAATITAWTKYEGNVSSINLTQVTSSPATGSDVYVNVGAKTTTVGTVAGATTTGAITQLRGYLSSYPAGGYASVASSVNVQGATAGTPTVPTGAATTTAASNIISVLDADDAAGLAAYDVASSTTAGLASFKFNPTVAGTYVLTVFNDGPAVGATTIGNNMIDSNEAVQTISITVTAAAGLSTALSSALLGADYTDADNTGLPTTATDAADKPVAIKTLGQKAAQILVTTRNASNAIYTGNAISVSITGSGFVSAGSAADADANGVPTATELDTADGSATTTRTASVTAAANTTGIVGIAVWGDGTSGTGTIKIEVTDKVSGVTSTLATKTVTFHGTVATLTATTLQGVATAGAANGCSNATTCTQATLALTPAVVIVAKDSSGVVVPGLTITGTPSDTAIVGAATVTAVTGGDDKNGRGYYNASLTGGNVANSGKSTTITWSTTLADGTTKITTTSSASVGGTPATASWSVDKTSYTAGAPVVITVTAKDAAGNPVGDGTYANFHAGAATLGGSFTGSTPAASVEIVGGKATYTAYAPGTAGSYVVSNKLGTSLASAVQGSAVSASVVVTSATDAQIVSLISKINALAAIIAKIQKKLGIK